MSFQVIGLLGDSIANGYWDEDGKGGWFGRFSELISKKYPHQYGFNNMAQDGDRVCDVYHRMATEVLTRGIDVLLIAVGVNDIIRPYQPNAAFDISEHLRSEYWTKLLSLAQKNVKKIIVIGLLPVCESRYPDQDWADLPIYTFNEDIKQYNELIKEICLKNNVSFYNPYDSFVIKNLESLYIDACHPTAQGHSILSEEIYQNLKF